MYTFVEQFSAAVEKFFRFSKCNSSFFLQTQLTLLAATLVDRGTTVDAPLELELFACILYLPDVIIAGS